MGVTNSHACDFWMAHHIGHKQDEQIFFNDEESISQGFSQEVWKKLHIAN